MRSEATNAMSTLETREAPFHRPVLVHETLELLAPRRGATLVDCTVGTGGHAEVLLDAVGPSGRVVGLDRDLESLRRAAERLRPFGDCFQAVHADFRDLPRVLTDRGIPGIDGLLADLGFSSFQMGSAERGFSFSLDGPLDMRMDRSRGRTAADLVATLPEAELARIVRDYGEERAARRIARALVRERERRPIRMTSHLTQILDRCTAGRRGMRIHPATRTFQALRIAVNGELEGLDRFVSDACGLLVPGGRAALITFHSLEDRVVKRTILALTRRCTCPPNLPHCVCGRPGIVERITRRAVRPQAEEVRENPRSRSARLRVARRLPEAVEELGETRR